MGVFSGKESVETLNLVNESNQVTPNYDLSGQKITVRVLMSPDKTVGILGELDNYVCWCSFTHLEDAETNKRIFDYIANNRLEKVSSLYSVIGYKKYDETARWYSYALNQSENTENHGHHFAGSIQQLYDDLLEKCRFRSMDGAHKAVLAEYLDLLMEETEYERIKPLDALLKEEAYLKLSPDEAVRELYWKCADRSRYLYNCYMDWAR